MFKSGINVRTIQATRRFSGTAACAGLEIFKIELTIYLTSFVPRTYLMLETLVDLHYDIFRLQFHFTKFHLKGDECLTYIGCMTNYTEVCRQRSEMYQILLHRPHG